MNLIEKIFYLIAIIGGPLIFIGAGVLFIIIGIKDFSDIGSKLLGVILGLFSILIGISPFLRKKEFDLTFKYENK